MYKRSFEVGKHEQDSKMTERTATAAGLEDVHILLKGWRLLRLEGNGISGIASRIVNGSYPTKKLAFINTHYGNMYCTDLGDVGCIDLPVFCRRQGVKRPDTVVHNYRH